MKKIFIFIIVVTAVYSLFATESGKFKTIIEIETEQKISERIEELLTSFVGESVVIVDIDLKYQTSRSQNYKTDNEAFYMDDIQKIKSEVMKNNLTNNKNDQIRITRIRVSVYLKKSVKSDKEDFVERSLIDWLGLDLEDGDELNIYKTLAKSAAVKKTNGDATVTQPGVVPNDRNSFLDNELGITTNMMLILIISLVLVIILIFLIFTLRFGIRSLNKTIKQIKTPNTGSQFRGKASSASSSMKEGFAILDESKRNPLGINIIENQKNYTEDLIDFSFLANLTDKEFFNLIDQQNIQKNELSYLLSVLPINYVNQLLLSDSKERTNKLIELMMKEERLSKDRLIELKATIVKSYHNIIDEQVIKIDGKLSLIKFVNNLSNGKAKLFFDRITELDQKTALEIRDKIFLYEDIVKLDDPILKDIIFELDHDMLVDFLAGAEESIKSKFIANMTNRTRSIVNEELQFAGSQTDEEKDLAVDNVLRMIKTLLGYI